MIPAFNLANLPRIIFGPGRLNELPAQIRSAGKNVLILLGSRSFKASSHWPTLETSLKEAGINFECIGVKGEPSPELVDSAVSEFGLKDIHCVTAIGGGSVIDAGKAVSAMLPLREPVSLYLEGVGDRVHSGQKVFFIGVPTTAGTGSEATKNAVISRKGKDGFKKSLRHDNFVPDIALIDPELMLACPPALTAACGMDALCQLLEPYVSTKATPLTDALSFSGLQFVRDSLVPACGPGANDVNVRSGMAYGALLSGIVLANAGLGIVHGLASPIGGYFNIPHGVVCGTLLGAATRATVRKLKAENNTGALTKYAGAGRLFSREWEEDPVKCCDRLVEVIDMWTEKLEIPRLGKYGIKESDIDRIAEGTGNKNNPAILSKDEIKGILTERL
jgi:alcohol dehydrogenase class IV